MLKPKFRLKVLLLLCAAIGSLALSKAIRTQPFSFSQAAFADSSTIVPFTAAYTVTDYSAKGDVRRIDNKGFAVRSDGSRVDSFFRSNLNGGIAPMVMRIVTDRSGSKRTHVDPFSESTTTYSIGANEIAALAQKPSHCTGEPAGKILDFDVVKTESDISGNKSLGPEWDKFHITKWLAPELNCLALREDTALYNNGSVTKRSVVSYTDVRLGEPDPALFSVPQGYTERSPSQVMAESAIRYPKTMGCSPECSASHSKFDDIYFKAQKSPAAPIHSLQ